MFSGILFYSYFFLFFFFFFQAEDGIRDGHVTGVQTCALPIFLYENKEWVDYLSDRIPLKRPGQPQDLDAAIVFLAAESSRYITGQTFLVDGGISTGATRARVSPTPSK